MTDVSDLPEDIIEEILSRLPHKSLMRFKCVHKSWNTLIKSHDFAAKHLSVSKNRNSSSTTILFKRSVIPDLNTNVKETVLSLLNLPDDYEDGDDRNLDSFLEDVRIPVSMGLSQRADIAGQCNGIVCLTDLGHNVVLCNPAIKEFKLLPEFSLSSPHHYPTVALGFGFDHKSKNYKLVRMLEIEFEKEYFDDFRSHITLPLKAEIYNLFTNSWEEIETGCFVKEKTVIWPHYGSKQKGICCNGILYWVGIELQKEQIVYFTDDEDDDRIRFNPTHYIISFDLSDETFRAHETHVLSLPFVGALPFTTFGLWNGSVALCRGGGEMQDIWVMDEFGSSWIKYLSFEFADIRLVTKKLRLLERGNKQFVVVGVNQVGRDFVLIFYNVHTHKYFKYLPRHSVSIPNTQVIEYVHSIVSINL